MASRKFTLCLILALSSAFLISSAADAQWVMIGRKSLGAIRNLRSEHSDVATVMLEAPADKVYKTAVSTLGTKQGVKITKADDAARIIDFTDGKQTMRMKVSRVEDKVSMLMVSADGSIRKSGDTSKVVEGVLRVCGEMKTKCELSEE